MPITIKNAHCVTREYWCDSVLNILVLNVWD